MGDKCCRSSKPSSNPNPSSCSTSSTPSSTPFSAPSSGPTFNPVMFDLSSLTPYKPTQEPGLYKNNNHTTFFSFFLCRKQMNN